jgi:uncharacterized protein YkwD
MSLSAPAVGRRIAIAVLLAALALVLSGTAHAVALTKTESTLLDRINRVRAAHKLPPLRLDPKLTLAARAHSFDMLRRDYFGHGAMAPRLLSFGVRARVLGENIAWAAPNWSVTDRVLRGWLNSPPHRANLLRPRFRRIGLAAPVGEFAGLRGAAVVTADFAG